MKKIYYLLISSLVSSNVMAKGIELRLQDTIISTNGFETLTKDEAKNVEVISNDDINQKNYYQVEDIFKSSPYINLTRNQFGSIIDLRGQGDNAITSVKLLVDGVPLNLLDTSHQTPPINSIGTSNIEKIEIIPGGGSVLYGNGATGGVINIITKADAKKDYSQGSLTYGTYDKRSANFGFGKYIGNKLYINLDYDGFRGNDYRKEDFAQYNSVNGSVAYDLTENQSLGFKFGYFTSNGNDTGAISEEELNNYRRAPSLNKNDFDLDKTNIAANYKAKLSDNIELKADVFYQKTNNDYTMGETHDHYKGAPLIYSYGSSGFFDEDKTGASLKTRFNHYKGNLIVGYDYLNNTLNRKSRISACEVIETDFPMPQYPIGDCMNNSLALSTLDGVNADSDIGKFTNSVFAMEKFKPVENIELSTGYRSEWAFYNINRIAYTTAGNNIESTINTNKHEQNNAFNLGASYLFSETGNLYINFEHGFISPSPTQFTNRENQKYVLNNLQSQTSNNYEIGIKNTIGFSFVSLTGFYSQNSNEIVQEMIGDDPLLHNWNFYNEGKTRRAGLEFFAEQYFSKITINQSFSYISTKVTEGENKGSEIPLVPRMKATLGLNYEIIPSVSYVAKGTFVSKSKESRSNDAKIPSHYLVDTAIKYTHSKTNLFTMIGIDNVFNEKYNVYQITSETGSASYIPAAGRTYYITLGYKF